ncbi:hypothetical protein SAMN05421868_15916 [Paenibacillus naphthalenovorans]|nr:hypothetical protein SAMN05421868_15916 [Paenibacillus naphthalenovorans]
MPASSAGFLNTFNQIRYIFNFKQKRKKQQDDNRVVIITLVSAIISLTNSIISLIITLSD